MGGLRWGWVPEDPGAGGLRLQSSCLGFVAASLTPGSCSVVAVFVDLASLGVVAGRVFNKHKLFSSGSDRTAFPDPLQAKAVTFKTFLVGSKIPILRWVFNMSAEQTNVLSSLLLDSGAVNDA